MKKLMMGVSLALMTGTVVAGDQDFDKRWYVTPSIGIVIPDGDKNASMGLAPGIAIGKFLSKKISVDLEYDTVNLDLNGGGDISQRTLSLMGRFHFNEKMGFRPYLGLGAGSLHHDTPSGSDGVFSFAAGMAKEFTDKVKLRTELRYRKENSTKSITGSSSFNDYIFNAGLNIALGDAPVQTTKTQLVEQSPQLDGDNDGVSDANDRCPNTPAGTKVDSTGCAIVDGDDDNDGVANSKDMCPNSKPGAVVGKDGCEVQMVIELQGVHFDTDKSTLKAESIAILNAAVKTLGQHGTLLVEVAGHTDSSASDDYNQKLSERRAEVVYTYLVDHGISSDRMTWKGYGESQPISTNDTDDGKAKNRRTELIVQ